MDIWTSFVCFPSPRPSLQRGEGENRAALTFERGERENRTVPSPLRERVRVRGDGVIPRNHALDRAPGE
ncbi:hypothetical protein BZH78_04030 [Salmonella enterica]|nr:hypothetical protein [Salmonella enterica]EBV7267789.1 hypothetical protein [Salmonella enterica subsp. enterica serovar Havana]EAM6394536.1 hypothetical protein [Salmonella enterica]EAN4590230.1 hypothetical protein [Salmonella enterica]EAS2825619.1 hypothetical protein [Salmonella enterica]